MKKSIRIGDGVAEFFGTHDGNIKYLESLLKVQVHIDGENNLTIDGDDHHVQLVERMVEDYAQLRAEGGKFTNGDLKSVIRIIPDEAQNTTPEQMKMFLTRIGYNSKAVITGDITQVDLPLGKMSGLIEARNVISGVEGISFIHFNERDVVRHPLVQRIVRAYESYSAQNIARQQSLQFGQDGASA